MTTINDDELLSIRLAMEELQLARETVFGKCSADSDIGAALDLQAHELAIALTSATDRHMSQSIANAQRTDGVIIDQMESIQAQEEADHALARSLANSVESTCFDSLR
jgi:hypothetical protein